MSDKLEKVPVKVPCGSCDDCHYGRADECQWYKVVLRPAPQPSTPARVFTMGEYNEENTE